MVRLIAQGGRFCAVAALGASALLGNAFANTLTVGPVEQVNVKNSTIVVLGQTYQVGQKTSLASVSPGDLVSISGTETASGSAHVSGLTLLQQQNVPGATTLLVTGIASSVNSVGEVHIGKLTVDITATLVSDSWPISTGQLVSVVGTQPSAKGTFLAQRIQPEGVGGTGLNGVGGTGSLGVGGTGTKGVGGTGYLGVGGTGSLGVGGTGSLGVGGTGTKGVGGTGYLGVGGTGSLGVGGTGSLGVGGTGTKGVGGTGSLGVGGTGSLGVGGTGSLGVGGTGTKGVGGTGSLGVGGTGSLGVGGTGTKGVGGTGSLGVGGTGSLGVGGTGSLGVGGTGSL